MEAPPPEHCPGTQSENAGKASACQGCPNAKICSSGAANVPDPAIAVIGAKLASVKQKILVMSGKGGVGKSTVSSLLSRAFAANNDLNVGLLDIDICGPSIPHIMGCDREEVHQSGSGWSPVFVEENLSVMSVGFLLDSPKSAVIWRGPRKNGLIKQFLTEVDWGNDLDVLLIDTPPGTSDEHLSIATYLSESNIDGAIIVTTPQDVSILDVRKEIDFCKRTKIPVIGVIENMSLFVCPKCKVSEQHKHTTCTCAKFVIFNVILLCSMNTNYFLRQMVVDVRLQKNTKFHFLVKFQLMPIWLLVVMKD